jgi:hypothetical protein
MLKYLLLVFLAFGCSTPSVSLDDMKYKYTSGIFKVASEGPLNEDVLRSNLELAQRMLVDEGFIGSDAQFNYAYFGCPIYILKARNWKKGDVYLDGEFDWGVGVVVSKDMGALVHEFLHYWDDMHWAFGTANHDGWDRNGYFDVSDRYDLLVETRPLLMSGAR